MATLLLVVIYLSFISLGVPDSLLGTAWPVLYREFGVPLASQSVVSILCSLATMTSSMNSARIISRLGTGKVTAFSTLLTAAALLGFSFSGSLWFMCLMAIPLGLGAGCVDSALNNYVSIHYNATAYCTAAICTSMDIPTDEIWVGRAQSCVNHKTPFVLALA